MMPRGGIILVISHMFPVGQEVDDILSFLRGKVENMMEAHDGKLV